MIKAEAHSDDRAIEVKFDATPYFDQVSSDNSIMNIIACDYRNDYATDKIAEDYPNNGDETHIKLREMFTYIIICNRVRVMGFEVSVDEDDLLLWVKLNRPHLIDAIVNHYHLNIDDTWEYPEM